MKKAKIFLFLLVLLPVLLLFVARFFLIPPNNTADIENTFYWLVLIVAFGLASFKFQDTKKILYFSVVVIVLGVILGLLGATHFSEQIIRFSFVIWIVGIVNTLISLLKSDVKKQ